MTEYDYSPDAIERYMAKQAKIADWVDECNAQSHKYSNPFVPRPASTAASMHPSRPSSAAPTRRPSPPSPTLPHSHHHPAHSHQQPPPARSKALSPTRSIASNSGAHTHRSNNHVRSRSLHTRPPPAPRSNSLPHAAPPLPVPSRTAHYAHVPPAQTYAAPYSSAPRAPAVYPAHHMPHSNHRVVSVPPRGYQPVPTPTVPTQGQVVRYTTDRARVTIPVDPRHHQQVIQVPHGYKVSYQHDDASGRSSRSSSRGRNSARSPTSPTKKREGSLIRRLFAPVARRGTVKLTRRLSY